MNINIETLKENPYFVQELNDLINGNCSDNPNIVSVPARDGNLYMVINTNSGKEIRMNSSYKPVEEAEKWASRYDTKNLNVVVSMFGFGNGYCARALLKRLGNDAKLIIIELDKEIFKHTINNYDISDIIGDKRVIIRFWNGNGKDYIDALEENVHWTNAGAQITCVHPQYEKLFDAEIKEFMRLFSDHSERVYVNRNTEVFFAKSFIENILRNIKNINKASTLSMAVSAVPKDIPAIIVAAGPSLDNNIELLKEAKGKAFILATDTALRSLKKHGITPDATLTIDPRKPVKYFENVEFENLPLFCSTQSNAKAIAMNNSKKILFGCDSYINKKFNKYGIIISEYNPGGSVATAAFAVCVELGFKRIVLIGQDLAYKGEITHADGRVIHVRRENYGIRYVEGINGEKIKTRHDWFIYLTWFEDSIAEVNKIGIEVIDATEGGALIHGAKLMTLREVIDTYCDKEFDFTSALLKLKPAFDEEGIKNIRKDFETDEKDLEFIKEKAKEGSYNARRGLNEFKKNKKVNSLVEGCIKKISKINGQISSKTVYKLVDDLVKVDNFERIQNYCQYGDNEEENIIKTFEDAEVLLDGTVKGAKELKELFEQYRLENGGTLC